MSAQLDAYLAELARHLQASPAQTEEVLREVRSHLECAALARADRGDEALALALADFGDAATIGRGLRELYGRATWAEAGLMALPMLLFGGLAGPIDALPGAALAIFLLAAMLAWQRGWPAWWYAWLGWLPFLLPSHPPGKAWLVLAFLALILMVLPRGWLRATLVALPLPTFWAFDRLVMSHWFVTASGVARSSPMLLAVFSLFWAGCLVALVRTRPGGRQALAALAALALSQAPHAVVWAVARLQFPLPESLDYILNYSLPYVLVNGGKYILFLSLAAIPAGAELVRHIIHRLPGWRSAIIR